MVIALAVKLSCAGELKPSLEMLGHRAVQQGAFWMAGVVGFGGFGWLSWLRGMRVPTRVMVNVLWRTVARALHRAAPVWWRLALSL